MSAFSVRRLTPEDLDAYKAIRLRMLREEPQAFGADFATSAALPAEAWRKRLEPEGDWAIFGGLLGEDLVGLAAFLREAPLKRRHIGQLIQVYLAPEARGRGFARPVVAAALAHGEAQPGIRAIELHVVVENLAARRLYESLGFVETGRRIEAVHVEGRFHDDLLMRRPVTPSGSEPAPRA